jgi:hypothetical protein
MGAAVIEGVESAIKIEQRYLLAINFDQLRLPGRYFIYGGYSYKLRHEILT